MGWDVLTTIATIGGLLGSSKKVLKLQIKNTFLIYHLIGLNTNDKVFMVGYCFSLHNFCPLFVSGTSNIIIGWIIIVFPLFFLLYKGCMVVHEHASYGCLLLTYTLICWYIYIYTRRGVGEDGQVHSNAREGHLGGRREHWHHRKAAGQHRCGEHRAEPAGPPGAALHLPWCPLPPLRRHPLRGDPLSKDLRRQ